MYVSNDLPTVANFATENYQKCDSEPGTGPGLDFNVSCSVNRQYQYVIIRKDSLTHPFDKLELCEVEVYGMFMFFICVSSVFLFFKEVYL